MRDVEAGLSNHPFKRGNDLAELFAKKRADAHKPPFRIAKTVVACTSLAKQAARWAAEAHVSLRIKGWDDTKAAAPRTRTRPARARLKRKSRAEAPAQASGKACDWLAPYVHSGISQDSLDPRSFRGHSLQVGHVFDAGDRALDRRIIFCAKCGALYWERADALCRSCKQHPGGCASQLRKLRSGLFPNRRYPGWTVESVRRPTLDEANTLVAQLESCEAGLGRSVWGRPPPREHEWPHRQRICYIGGATLGQTMLPTWACSAGKTLRQATWLLGGVWDQRSAGGQARLQGCERRASSSRCCFGSLTRTWARYRCFATSPATRFDGDRGTQRRRLLFRPGRGRADLCGEPHAGSFGPDSGGRVACALGADVLWAGRARPAVSPFALGRRQC